MRWLCNIFRWAVSATAGAALLGCGEGYVVNNGSSDPDGSFFSERNAAAYCTRGENDEEEKCEAPTATMKAR